MWKGHVAHFLKNYYLIGLAEILYFILGHTHPLLGTDRETSKCAPAVTK
jgi:hypothetical protein